MVMWKAKFQVKDLLTTSDDAETVVRVATEIIARLTTHQPFGDDTQDIIDAFAEAKDSADLGMFNDAMNDLYDIANEQRIWIE
jgi:hypothetical protein